MVCSASSDIYDNIISLFVTYCLHTLLHSQFNNQSKTVQCDFLFVSVSQVRASLTHVTYMTVALVFYLSIRYKKRVQCL